MFKKISYHFINNLLLRTDIVDIINLKIKLKKIGKNFKILCPFHNEKTPSFTVSQEKQFFYCFGCGIHGNAIDFLIKYDNSTFVESIKEISSYYGVKVIYDSPIFNKNKKIYIEKKNLFYLIEKLKKFYVKTLKSKYGIRARDYLKNRGLNEKIIKVFSIGYSSSNLNKLKQFCLKNKISSSLIHKLGSIYSNDGINFYDKLKDRIIFPILNTYGKVVAFGGRAINDDNNIKYLNSPKTTVFDKGSLLYGLYEIQKKFSKLPQLLLVEGYMDVISLTQFGINYAVSSLGTSTTINHIKLMYFYTNRIICCYDGDCAGRLASWRFLLKVLPFLTDDKQLCFIFLPEGQDPDTLIRKIGKKSFEKLIKNYTSLSTFLFNTFLSKVDLSRIDGRVKLSSLLLPLINKIPGNVLRFYIRRKLGFKLGILDPMHLERVLLKLPTKLNIPSLLVFKRTIMRLLIGLLLQNPFLFTLVPSFEGIEKDALPGLKLFTELVKICKSNTILNTSQLLEYYRDDKNFNILKFLSNFDYLISKEFIEKTFIETLLSLFNSLLILRQDLLINNDRIYGLTTEEKRELWFINKILSKKK